MSSESILTTRLTGPVDRDAVHVAYIAVQAGQTLKFGEMVRMMNGKAVQSFDADAIGIVNPFIETMIQRDEWFLMLLMPGTVTGMRHHWQHPAFIETDTAATEGNAASVAWLQNAAIRLGVPYEELIADWSPLENDDYYNNGEHIRNVWCELQDEFWLHHKIVTGRDVPEEKRGGFTCSC